MSSHQNTDYRNFLDKNYYIYAMLMNNILYKKKHIYYCDYILSISVLSLLSKFQKLQ
jgi:hypothetical protein